MSSIIPTQDSASTLESKSRQTRSQILAAAARLTREQGYTASTLRMIAHAADVEAGSIYYHFNSKEEILEEVLDLGLRQIFDAVSATRARCKASGSGFRETFAAMVETHLTYLLRDSDFTSSNIRNFPMLPAAIRSRHRLLRSEYAEIWHKLLREGVEAGEIRSDIRIVPLRQFILGALNWTSEWYDVNRYPVGMLAGRAAKLVLDGMSTTRGAPIAFNARAQSGRRQPADPATKAGRTRWHILTCAARLMRAQGFSATTMRHIADTAGVRAGSIYYHFSSKDEILDEVLDRGLRDMLEGVSELFSDPDGFPDARSRIAAGIHLHMMYLFARSEFTSANIRIYGQLPEEARARHRPVRQAYGKLWDAQLSGAQQAGAIRPDIKVVPLRQLMLGALNWTVEWFDPARGGEEGFYTLEGVTSMLQSLLLDGITRPDAPESLQSGTQ
jgi:TetR/AcrR family transcriptional regulator, cholesterol catabolism regulator